MTEAPPHFVQTAGCGLLLEILCEVLALFRAEVFGMPPQQRDQAAVLQACRIEQPPDSEELLLDQANHVESIGDDRGLGKKLSNQRPDRSTTGPMQTMRTLCLPLSLLR